MSFNALGFEIVPRKIENKRKRTANTDKSETRQHLSCHVSIQLGTITMSDDEENKEKDDNLSISRSPLRRTRQIELGTGPFQDPFEPLPLLPPSDGGVAAQRQRLSSIEAHRQHEMLSSQERSGRFLGDDDHNAFLRAQQMGGQTYEFARLADRNTSSERQFFMAQHNALMDNSRRQMNHQVGGNYLYARDYRDFTSNRGVDQHVTLQQGFMTEQGIHGLNAREHHSAGPFGYYPMNQGRNISQSSQHHYDSLEEGHGRRDIISAKRSYEEYNNSIPDETNSKEVAENPLMGGHSSHEQLGQDNQSLFRPALHVDDTVGNTDGREDFESDFHHEGGSEVSPLLYSHAIAHTTQSSDESENLKTSVARLSRQMENKDISDQSHRRMTRDEYFASLDSHDTVRNTVDPQNKKLKASDSQESEGGDSRGLEGDTRLVHPEDKMFSTSFSFGVLSEIQSCRFEPSDMKGKRRGLTVGFPGLSCRHCKGDSLNNGRFFPSSIKTMSDTSKLLMPLYNHLIRCKRCPQDIKDELTNLQKEHEKERKLQTFGSQKAFFMKIWNRLHGELPTQKGCTGRGKSFRLLLGTSESDTTKKKSPVDFDSDDSEN